MPVPKSPPAKPATRNRSAANDKDCGALLGAIRNRDPRALHQLYQRMVGQLYALAYCIVRDSAYAEEIVEDVFLQVWQSPEAWDESRGQVAAWLTVLCRSRALDTLRRLKKTTLVFHPEPVELAAGDDWLADPHEWSLALFETPLRDALDKLSLAEQRVIELIFAGGLSHDEVASATGMPLGTVKSHARRGLARLRLVFQQFRSR